MPDKYRDEDNQRLENLFSQLLQKNYVREDEWTLFRCLRPQRIEKKLSVLQFRTRFITLALEAVHGGHNQSACLRSAEAFGVQNISIIEGEEKFEPNRGVTQNADKWLTLRRFDDTPSAVKSLRKNGYRIWATNLSDQAISIEKMSLDRPAALFFGNEKDGCSGDLLRQADGHFMIPMRGFVQSFNVSVAAAVTLHELTKRAQREAPEKYFLNEKEKRSLFRKWLLQSSRPVRRMLRAQRESNAQNDR